MLLCELRYGVQESALGRSDQVHERAPLPVFREGKEVGARIVMTGGPSMKSHVDPFNVVGLAEAIAQPVRFQGQADFPVETVEYMPNGATGILDKILFDVVQDLTEANLEASYVRVR